MGKRSRDDDDFSTASGENDSCAQGSPAKVVELDTNDIMAVASMEMQCSLPPHRPILFPTAEEFDVHYAKEHSNRCSSCGKNFPSAHYLTLHIDENHNPVRAELAAKGERTYACFIENCERKCSTPQKRRLHLIDKHMFPKVYNFRIVDQGIDKANSLLQGGQRRRLSTNETSGRQRRFSRTFAELSSSGTATVPIYGMGKALGEQKETASDDHVDELAKSLSALNFVPPSVRAKHHRKNKETQLKH